MNPHDMNPKSDATLNWVSANYERAELSEFSGNPLIEALPPIPDSEAWMRVLESVPTIDVCERQLPVHLRTQCTMRLLRFFQPLPQHIELAGRVDLILRQGYLERNPLNGDRVKIMQRAYEHHPFGGGATTAGFVEARPIFSSSVVGVSGVGKTTTVRRILGAYPPVIYHPKYHLHQVVWLKLDCPPDGSLKQLLANLVAEFDRLLGTDFSREIKSRTALEEIHQLVNQLAAVYNLGVLVIDEIQNLSVKRSGGREVMMNFFQELCNELNVPVLLMGTMKAARVLQLDFRQARRNAAIGSFTWDRLKNDNIWKLLLESLWRFQWVRNPASLNTEMTDYLHERTQGLVAVLITAFSLAQMRAINAETETLTKKLFDTIFERELKPIHPMLKALRSGDPRRIARYEDIALPQVGDLLEREQQSMLQGARMSTTQQKLQATEEQKAELALADMWGDAAQARAAVKRAVDSGAKTRSQIVKAAIELQSADQPRLTDPEEDPDDLRRRADPSV